MRKALRCAAIAGAIAVLSVSSSLAGPYADDLSQCLVNRTSDKDKTDLVRWFFAAAALHPDVSNITSVSDSQRTEMTRSVGKLFERLLTESCRSQYRDALKYEGEETLVTSFGVLGQVAMRGLLENPAVVKGLGELDAYVDKNKLKAVLTAKK